MKRAITIVGCIGGVGFLAGVMTYRMGSQLHWNGAHVAGVYICFSSATIILIAAVLNGVYWIRKNVRIQ